jgi:hypothetical protein
MNLTYCQLTVPWLYNIVSFFWKRTIVKSIDELLFFQVACHIGNKQSSHNGIAHKENKYSTY